MRRDTLYSVSLFGWILLVVGTTAALYTGAAESIVPPSALPQSNAVMIGAPVLAIVLGTFVFLNRKSAAWKSMGRQAGLTPEGGSVLPIGEPTLSGTVDGRPVRVRKKSLKSGGTQEGSSQATYTVVEADLSAPAAEGVVIARGDPDATDQETFDVGSLSVRMTPVDGPFGTVTGSEDLARDVLTDPVRDSLTALDSVGMVLVGAASETISQAVPDVGDSWLGGKMVEKVDEKLAGDSGTVTHQFRGTLLDGEELGHQVRAVSAVADAFEDATMDSGETSRTPGAQATGS